MSMLPVDVYKRLDPDLIAVPTHSEEGWPIVIEVNDVRQHGYMRRADLPAHVRWVIGDPREPAPAVPISTVQGVAQRGQVVQGIVKDYLDGYDSPTYGALTRTERDLMNDVVQGLLAEPEFLRAVYAWCQAAGAVAYKD